MVSEVQEKVAVAQQQSGAAPGVPAATGAATGAPGTGAETPSQPEARQPQVVPLEDFKGLQRSLNQRADALANELRSREQTLSQLQQEMQLRDQQIEAMHKQLLDLKVAGLPQEEAEAERLKDERDRLQKHNEELLKYAQAARQAVATVQANVSEADARRTVINMFLQGGTKTNGQRVEGHAKYGLTLAELESCRTPLEMEVLAAEKRQAAIDARDAEVSRKEAAIQAKERKATGAQNFDRGEPTGGTGGIPQPGTPEFREYRRRVAAGEIRLRG